MHDLNAVSLFAGIGGFDLGLQQAGIPTACAVEFDAAAAGVFRRNYPTTPLFGDIRGVTADQLVAAGFVPESGVLVGGFPCQDLSVAGHKAGLAGMRSGLFHELARLVGELRPRWFILENVVGLLSSHRGRDMGTVLATLADLGYGLSYRVLDAQYFGVAQRRQRVFIVGRLGDDGSASAGVLALGEVSDWDPPTGRTPGEDVAYALAARAGRAGVDATDALNGHIVFSHTAGIDHQASTTVSPTIMSGHDRMPAMHGAGMLRRLTPVECERLQGFPDNWTQYRADKTKPQANGPRYKQLGNAVAVPVVRWIAQRLVAIDHH